MSGKAPSKDDGDMSWSNISERLIFQRNEARLKVSEDQLRYKRSLESLQNSAGIPSADFFGAIE